MPAIINSPLDAVGERQGAGPGRRPASKLHVAPADGADPGM